MTQRIALALRDDPDQYHEVLGTLRNKYGAWAAELVVACNRGAHGEALGDTVRFVRDAEKLALELRKLR